MPILKATHFGSIKLFHDKVILGIVSTCFLVYILYKLVIWCLGAFGFSDTEGQVGNEELNAGQLGYGVFDQKNKKTKILNLFFFE